MMRKFIRKLKNHYFSSLMYTKYYNKCKINPKMILLESQHGKEVNGNIYYILKELTKEKYKDYKVYLTYIEKSKNKINKILSSNNIKNVSLVRLRSIKYYKIISKAKYLINDVSFLPFFIKKEGQIYLNTWHGTPLKTLGRKVKNDYKNIGNTQRNFIIPDYLLYPNEFTRDVMLDDYMVRELTDAKVILEGYPRNAAFFENGDRVREKYKLKDKFVIAYMPTWRGIANKQNNKMQSANIKNVLDSLEKKLKKNQILYVNLHPIEKATVDYSNYEKIKPFPEDIETYEFLNIADVLITDYSSVFFDYAITRKKIVLFPFDKEEYLKDRGLYFPMEELPFPIVYKISELIKEINSEKQYSDKEFLNKYCKYDKEDVTEKICEKVILNKDNSCRVQDIEKNNKENVLIYAGNLNGDTNSIILKNILNSINLEANNYYVCYDAKCLNPNKNILADFNDNINYISFQGIMNLSLIKKVIFLLHSKGFVKFDHYIKFLSYDYKLELKRLFGNIKFAKVIDLDISSFKKNILFSFMNCEKIVCFYNAINSSVYSDKDVFNYITSQFDKILIDPNQKSIKNRIVDKNKIFEKSLFVDVDSIEKFADTQNFIDDYALINISNGKLLKTLASKDNFTILYVDYNDFDKIKKIVDEYKKNWKNIRAKLIIVGEKGNGYNKVCDYVYDYKCPNDIIVIKSLKNFYPIIKKADSFIFYSLNKDINAVMFFNSIKVVSSCYNLKKKIINIEDDAQIKDIVKFIKNEKGVIFKGEKSKNQALIKDFENNILK